MPSIHSGKLDHILISDSYLARAEMIKDALIGRARMVEIVGLQDYPETISTLLGARQNVMNIFNMGTAIEGLRMLEVAEAEIGKGTRRIICSCLARGRVRKELKNVDLDPNKVRHVPFNQQRPDILMEGLYGLFN